MSENREKNRVSKWNNKIERESRVGKLRKELE